MRDQSLHPFAAAHAPLPPGNPAHAGPEGILTVDAQLSIVGIDTAAQQMFRCTPAQTLGRPLSRLVPERLREVHDEMLRQTLTKEGARQPLGRGKALVGLRTDGEEFPIEATLVPMDVLTPAGPARLYTALVRELSATPRDRRTNDPARRRLQWMTARQVQAREDERQHIARELHDELGQRLVALKFELAELEAKAQDDAASARPVAGLLTMVDDLVVEVRRLATELRPMLLDDLGLNAAIESLANETARRLGLTIRLQLQDIEFAPAHPAPIALYRIVQEALTNVARHARATEVAIHTRAEAAQLVMVVEDNGIGFGKAPSRDGSPLGLVGMRERAQVLGGQLLLGKGAAEGARIEVRIPLPRAIERRRGGATPQIAVLAQDLQVHQLELENQNEELRRTQQALAAAHDRYVHLYDFAPVAYLTLNHQDAISELNLAAARLLGRPRDQLKDAGFEQFVISADLARWRHHSVTARAHVPAQRTELALKTPAGTRVNAQLDSLRVIETPSKPPSLLITLTDVSHLKLAEMDRRIAASAVAAREGDRRRVARQLHDELGQQLCALKMNLADMQEHRADAGEPERVDLLLNAVDTSLESVRRMATELRPLLLDDLGLLAALDWLGHDRTRRNGIEVGLSLDEAAPPLDEATSVALYRLTEELLALGSRGASQGHKLMLSLHRQSDELVLRVHCEGTGWPVTDPEGDARALGSLPDLVRMVDGQLRIEASADIGWAATVRLAVKGWA